MINAEKEGLISREKSFLFSLNLCASDFSGTPFMLKFISKHAEQQVACC